MIATQLLAKRIAPPRNSYRHNISIRLRKIRHSPVKVAEVRVADAPKVKVTEANDGGKSDGEVEDEDGEAEESAAEDVEDGLFQCEFCEVAFGEGLLSASIAKLVSMNES